MLSIAFILSIMFLIIQYVIFITNVIEEKFGSKKEFLLMLIPFGPVIQFGIKAINLWRQL